MQAHNVHKTPTPAPKPTTRPTTIDRHQQTQSPIKDLSKTMDSQVHMQTPSKHVPPNLKVDMEMATFIYLLVDLILDPTFVSGQPYQKVSAISKIINGAFGERFSVFDNLDVLHRAGVSTTPQEHLLVEAMGNEPLL